MQNELSDAMIAAGNAAFEAEMQRVDMPPDAVVVAVYLAMRAAAPFAGLSPDSTGSYSLTNGRENA